MKFVFNCSYYAERMKDKEKQISKKPQNSMNDFIQSTVCYNFQIDVVVFFCSLNGITSSKQPKRDFIAAGNYPSFVTYPLLIAFTYDHFYIRTKIQYFFTECRFFFFAFRLCELYTSVSERNTAISHVMLLPRVILANTIERRFAKYVISPPRDTYALTP